MRIHHVGYLVKNIEKTEKKLKELGFEVEVDKKEDYIRKVYIEFMKNEEYRVELVQPNGQESEYFPLLKKYKNQPYHICFVAGNLQEKIRELEEKHYIVVKGPQQASCLNDKMVAFLSAGGIEMIELLEDSRQMEE